MKKIIPILIPIIILCIGVFAVGCGAKGQENKTPAATQVITVEWNTYSVEQPFSGTFALMINTQKDMYTVAKGGEVAITLPVKTVMDYTWEGQRHRFNSWPVADGTKISSNKIYTAVYDDVFRVAFNTGNADTEQESWLAEGCFW